MRKKAFIIRTMAMESSGKVERKTWSNILDWIPMIYL